MNSQPSSSAVPSDQLGILESMHQLMLEALRHREQEIFQYLAILGPALGGFVLLYVKEVGADAFVVGTIGVLLLLLLGAWYSLTLGYNFRYITLELAKLETILGVRDAMLIGWPRTKEEFLNRFKTCCDIPWCTPPEMIKVFWWAFLIGVLGILASIWFLPTTLDEKHQHLIIGLAIGCFAIGFLAPIHFGRKLQKQIKNEPDTWGWMLKTASELPSPHHNAQESRK